MNIIPLKKFEEVFNEIIQRKEKAIMLFTSPADDKGNYWCTDCQAIAPLYQTFQDEAKKAGLPLFVFMAGDRPTWKDPKHKFRTNKLLGVQGIPTMGYFNGKKLTRHLVEGELLQKQQRALLFENSSL